MTNRRLRLTEMTREEFKDHVIGDAIRHMKVMCDGVLPENIEKYLESTFDYVFEQAHVRGGYDERHWFNPPISIATAPRKGYRRD